jgi:WD40 repeat protein
MYELLDAGHKNWVLCIAWSPDGKHLVSGSKAGELQCWDPQTGKPSGNLLVVKSLFIRMAGSSYRTWVVCQCQFWHTLETFRCKSFHLTVSNTMLLYCIVLLLGGSYNIKEINYLSQWPHTCNNLCEMGWGWSNIYWVRMLFCSTIVWNIHQTTITPILI